MKSTHLAVILSLVLCTGSIALATEPNDDFGSATMLGAGVLSVTDDLEGGLFPDTVLGAFDDGSFSVPFVTDDDSSPLGDGFADALFGIDVNPDGSIHLAVSGFDDFDFDGSHSFEGDYDLFIDVFDASGATLASFSDFSTLFSGAVDTFSFDDAAWIGGTFDVIMDNTVSGPGADPLDFWVFTGLTPGETFAAETSFPGGSIDTVLGWFDASGSLIAEDDDSGDDGFSLITGIVPASGEVALAVSGFPDEFFDGFHSESGPYTLTVSIVPEPSALLLVGLASMFLTTTRTRSTRG